MKYTIERTNRFKHSLKKCQKRGLDMNLFKKVISELAETGTLSSIYKPHKLTGKYKGKWECHIEPDWLMIWEQNDNALILLMIDTGTHSDLFG